MLIAGVLVGVIAAHPAAAQARVPRDSSARPAPPPAPADAAGSRGDDVRWGPPRQLDGDGKRQPGTGSRIACADVPLAGDSAADSTSGKKKGAKVSDRPGQENCRPQPYPPLPATKPRVP